MCPEAQPSRDQILFIVVREDDNRNIASLLLRPQLPQDFQAVHLRQADVEEDDIGGQVAGLFESLFAIEGGVDPIAVQFQLQPVHLEHRRVVFHEENIDQVFISRGCPARAGAAARLTFHNTPLGAKQYR